MGEVFELPEPGRPDVEALVRDLAVRGWDSDRIGAHALERQGAGLPWPHAPSGAVREGLGPAQFQAALTTARDRLGLAALGTRPPSRRTALTADELRLVAEVPPHHGT